MRRKINLFFFILCACVFFTASALANAWGLPAALEIVEKANHSIIDAWMPLHDRIMASTWATTAEAIPATFACLKLSSQSFKSGLILAANYARDADTIGAVAGAILGAKYGIDAIPNHWVEKTRYPSGTCLSFTANVDVINIGEKLADLIR